MIPFPGYICQSSALLTGNPNWLYTLPLFPNAKQPEDLVVDPSSTIDISPPPSLNWKNSLCACQSPVLIQILHYQTIYPVLLFFMLLLSILALFSLVYGQPSLTIHQTPLFGNFSLGYYYLFLDIGTPPQKQSFIVDTGSSLFAMPCKECTDCGNLHMSPRFDANLSTTSKLLTCASGQELCQNCHTKQPNDTCAFSNFYAQGSSLKGYLLEDRVSFSSQANNQTNPTKLNEQGISTIFACITKQTNQFLSQKADGILGIAPTSTYHFVKQIYKSHYPFTKENHSFSICMTDNGGVFTVGGLNKRLHTNINGVNTRFRKDYNVYSLNASSLFVGNILLNLTKLELEVGYGIFIDSGATFSYFPHRHYNSTLSILEDVCMSLGCQSFQGLTTRCFRFPQSKSYTLDDQINRFPNITLHFNTQDRIHWAPHRYFIGKNISNRQVCLAFSALDRFILGTSWMLDKDIHFDMNRQEVTIFEADCKRKQAEETPLNPEMIKKNQQPIHITNTEVHQVKQVGEKQQQQTSTPSHVQKQDEKDFDDADQQAWIISLSIVVVFASVAIALLVTCKGRVRQEHIDSTTMAIEDPPSQQYHDQISMTDIAQSQDNSARNI